MDQTKKTGGKSGPTSALHLSLNPPTPPPEGAEPKGTWVRLELDDEGAFTVRVFGLAEYGAPDGGVDKAGNITFRNRELSHFIDLNDPGLDPLKGALVQILEAYGPAVQAEAISRAYQARDHAIRHDDPNKKPAESPKEGQ